MVCLFHIKPVAELFRHRFLALLRDEKLISERKLRQLLAWTHSGFSLDAGEKPVAPHDVEGRKRLAEWERSGHRLPNGSPKGERSESIFVARPLLARKNHLERKNAKGHLPFQAQLAHQEELPDLFRDRFYRRDRRAYSAEESANGALLRSLLEQEPGLGGKIGKSPPAVEGIIRAPARGPF